MKIENGIVQNKIWSNEQRSFKEFIKNIHYIKQINGNLYLNHANLTELPNLSNIIINGDFFCQNNKLTSLKGCPKVVKGTVFLDKNVPLSKEILNIKDNLTRNKTYLNKEDCLPILRELQLNKILNG